MDERIKTLLGGIQEIREETEDQLSDLSTGRVDERVDIRICIDRLDWCDEVEELIHKEIERSSKDG
jgi:hypothetical protein